MSVMTVTTPITKRETVQVNIELVECKHGKKPVIQNVYTGTKKKFKGATASCGCDDCLCYAYDAEDVAKKWNHFHSKDTF